MHCAKHILGVSFCFQKRAHLVEKTKKMPKKYSTFEAHSKLMLTWKEERDILYTRKICLSKNL